MKRPALAALLLLLAAPPPGPIAFQDATGAAGIAFRYRTDLRHGRMVATMGGGVAAGDYDGDGALDLFFTGSAASGKRPLEGPCGALYRNRGDGSFEDATARAGIRSCGWTLGAHFVDVDSDGAPDLVVTGLGKTSLFHNRRDGIFEERSEAAGLVATRFAVGLAAGDVNGDGRVDLYVVNYLDTDAERERAVNGPMRFPEEYQGQEALLFVQGEDGRFRESAASAGVANRGGKGLGALFFDYDADGKPDLFVANDRAANVLYRGLGAGRFQDVTLETGAGARDHPIPRAGMGIAMGDADGDGFLDLFVTNFGGEPITLYRSVRGQLFEEGTEAAGIAAGSLPYVRWGTDLTDLDDDGWPDLVAVSGHLVPSGLLSHARMFRPGGLGSYGGGTHRYEQPPVVWRNLGGGRFTDVSAQAGDFAKLRLAGRGLAAGDFDGDGRVDLAIAAVSGGVRLLRNRSSSNHHALEIRPEPDSHRTALGTKVIVTAGGRRQVQEFVLRPSYASGSWTPLHFGLGEATRALVEVIPPGATEPAQRFEDVAADRLYQLRDRKLYERKIFRRALKVDFPLPPP